MASGSFRKIWKTANLKLVGGRNHAMGRGKYMVFEGSIENFIENGASVLEESISLFHGKTNPIRYFSVNELNAMNLEQHCMSFKESDTKWYKGFWDGKHVLVKEQSEKHNPFLRSGTFREISVAAQMSTHNNVHKLLGCCLETKYTVLVFEWVQNYTLYDLIFRDKNQDKPPLDWEARLRILWEISHAMAYLHTAFHRPIIHRNIKPHNVFLGQNNTVKLSDFSVSISVPEGKEYADEDLVVGTFGYLAPEYFKNSRVAESADVYSFGILFLEVLTGRKFVFETGEDNDVEIHIRDWVSKGLGHKCISDIIDPAITGVIRLTINEDSKQILRAAIKLALRCTAAEDYRPSMVNVATELKSLIMSSQSFPDIDRW